MCRTERRTAVTPSCSSTYPLLAQSYHHCIQTVVRRSHSGGCTGGAAVQLLFKLCNLPFQKTVLLLKTVGLRDTKYVFRDSGWLFFPTYQKHDAPKRTKKCDLKQYRLSLTSSMRRTRRSLRAAMAVRSWENRLRPSSLSALAAAKSSLSQSHSSTVAALREQWTINS